MTCQELQNRMFFSEIHFYWRPPKRDSAGVSPVGQVLGINTVPLLALDLPSLTESTNCQRKFHHMLADKKVTRCHQLLNRPSRRNKIIQKWLTPNFADLSPWKWPNKSANIGHTGHYPRLQWGPGWTLRRRSDPRKVDTGRVLSCCPICLGTTFTIHILCCTYVCICMYDLLYL